MSIELQVCHRCPATSRRYIGPDPRNIGLFNFNNQRLFSHELLTEYISAFTSSETPIDAWVRQTSRRYQGVGSTFIGRDVFMGTWFSFVRVMMLEPEEPEKKCCPKCGPAPKEVIWDGVSIAFGRRQVNNQLQPPTIVETDAPIHTAKPIPRKEWLTDSAQRRLLREWLLKGLDATVKEGEKNEKKLLEDVLRRREVFHDLRRWLALECTDLGQIFTKSMGFNAVKNQAWKPQMQYRRLFEVVSLSLFSIHNEQAYRRLILSSALKRQQCK